MKENEASFGTLGIIVCLSKLNNLFSRDLVKPATQLRYLLITMVAFLHFALLIAIEHHLVTLFLVMLQQQKNKKNYKKNKISSMSTEIRPGTGLVGW